MDIKIEATPRTALRMKGDVLLCDPCYFFPSERSEFFEAWQDLVRQMFPEGKSGELTDSGVVKVTTSGGLEFEFIYVSTKYGDGVFSLTEISQIGTMGTEIGVDAGLICAVNAKDAIAFAPGFVPVENGIVILGFDGEVTVDPEYGSIAGSGNGEFLVDTSGEDEDDEEEEEYEEEDEGEEEDEEEEED
jgi:hypothetical protein